MNNTLMVAAQIETLLGIIGELQTARANRLLKPLQITRSKFAVLRYLAEHETATITEITRKLEVNQPGVTKIVKQLINEELVSAQETGEDKRQKILHVTTKGKKKCEDIYNELMPAISLPYENWTEKDLATFAEMLGTLKVWMDENRDC